MLKSESCYNFKVNIFRYCYQVFLSLVLTMVLVGCQMDFSHAWEDIRNLRHHELIKQVKQVLFPSSGSNMYTLPRPPKPEKEAGDIPQYKIMSNVDSVTSGNVRRMQIIVKVAEGTKRVRFKYIYQDLVRRYRDQSDIIWMYLFETGKSNNYDISKAYPQGLISKAHWFSDSVPRYAHYRIAEQDEIYYGIVIEYTN